MDDLVFITGNQYKADFLAKNLGISVAHQKLDLDELQSLDLDEVVQHKVRQAYDIVKKPVLVDDVSLTFTAMGRLPGTLIKWFLEELGKEGLCDLAMRLPHQKAVAEMLYALYDGEKVAVFSGKTHGKIAPSPRGESHGWNAIFIPDGYGQTFAELSDEQFNTISHRGQAIKKLREFLTKQQKSL
jgi:XTP/dITP diphosphohydrolase